MSDAGILKIEDIPVFQRGDGVETTLLIGNEQFPSTIFTSGITLFPAGKKVPMHLHNCDEQVTLLDGTAECEMDGQLTALKPYDTTYIPAGKPHRFINTGAGPLRILWIYSSVNVTRTFAETGETVAHLSSGDMVNR